LLAINIVVAIPGRGTLSIPVSRFDSVGDIANSFVLTGIEPGIVYNSTLLISVTTPSKRSIQYTKACDKRNIVFECLAPAPVISGSAGDRTVKISLVNVLTNRSVSSGFTLVSDLVLSVFYTNPLNELETKLFFGDDPEHMSRFANNEFVISELSNGFTYNFSVILTNNIGFSLISNNVDLTPSDTPDVTNVSVVNVSSLENSPNNNTSKNSGIRVTFPEPEAVIEQTLEGTISIPVTSYTIERYLINQQEVASLDTTFSDLQNLVVSNGFISYNDNTSSVGSRYKYTVFASNKNGTGNSATSDLIKCLSLPDSPLVSVEPRNGSVVLTVLPPTNLGGSTVNSYYVRVMTNNGANLISASELTVAANNKITINGLTNGTQVQISCQTVTNGSPSGKLYGPKSDEVSSTPYTSPSAPTNLVSTNLDSGSLINKGLKLSWTQPGMASTSGGSEFTYSFFYSNDSNFSNSQSIEPDSLDESNNSAIFANLVVGNTYYFKVKANVRNTELNSDVSSQESSASDGSIVYSMPADISSVTLSQMQMVDDTLMLASTVVPGSESANNLAVSFQYRLKQSNGSNLSPSADSSLTSVTFGAANATFIVSTFAVNTAYYLLVTPYIVINGVSFYGTPKSSNNFGGGAGVETNNITLYNKPDAPSGFVLESRPNAIAAYWSLVTSPSNGVTIKGYNLYVNDESMSGAPDYQVGPLVNNAILTYFNGSAPIVNGSSYKVTIAAYGDVDVATAKVIAGVLGLPADTGAIEPTPAAGAPTSLTAIADNSQITLEWSNSDDEVDGYEIFMNSVKVFDISSNKMNLSADIGNLNNGQLYSFVVYSYKVLASGQVIKSNDSAKINATPYTASSTVKNLIATSRDGGASFVWDAPYNAGGAGLLNNGGLLYKVIVSTDAAGLNIVSSASADNLSLPTGSDPYVVSNLTNNSTYYVKVYAYYFAGTSNTLSKSLPASTTVVPIVKPLSHSNLSAVPSDSKVVLSWTHASDSYTTSSSTISRDGVVLDSLVPGTSTYTDNKAVNGTKHTYRLKRNLQNGLPVEYSEIDATPFGKPIVNNITVTEQSSGVYTNYSATIDVNGSALIGCFVLGVPVNTNNPILVITNPAIVNINGMESVVSGTFTEPVSSFAIAPYNAVGSVFVGYPEQNSGFGACK
jgi:hypothetical protein